MYSELFNLLPNFHVEILKPIVFDNIATVYEIIFWEEWKLPKGETANNL